MRPRARALACPNNRPNADADDVAATADYVMRANIFTDIVAVVVKN
jgi:hypothetical protein